MRQFVLLISILFSCFSSFSQNGKLANTLLWRISGNGLEKPSYLYGTMHLTDKRVFQLGDSVYKALEQTEGFAAELDMNSLGMQAINYFIKEKEEKNSREPLKVKDAVSEDTWNKYKDILENKFNKKADKITIDDLESIETKLQTELLKKGDMPTFLDAWISGKARRQGKWIGGIEDLEDQLEHVDNIESKIQLAVFDDNYYRGSLDWFINIYTSQKLDSIDAMMYREANGKKDYIMIKRNLKMARRMDSLMSIRNTLFAVGAAHLPGDSGVIALLRSKGFTVTPVFSSKKISPEKYVAKTVEVPWTPLTIKDSVYTLQMPGPAEGLSTLEDLGLDMKMYFDMSFMKLYMTFGMPLPEDKKEISTDSLYKVFSNRFSEKGNVKKEKKVLVNGLTGIEYLISTDDGEMKLQLFLLKSEWVIFNMVFGYNIKSVNDSESEKFFQSFVFNNNIRKPVDEEKVWNQLTYPELSFSVEMPVKPKEKKNANSEEGKIVYDWQSVDIKDQIFYGMNVSAMKEGMYNSASDSIVFLTIKENLKLNYKDAKITDSSLTTIDSYPAYKLTVIGETDGELFETKLIIVSRGGLSYYLFSVYSPIETKREIAEKFLNSFKLLPYKYPAWNSVTSPNNLFTTTSPYPIIKKQPDIEDDDSITERYYAYDSLAFVTSYIDKFTLPDWFWYSSDTAFLKFRSDQFSESDDSTTTYKLQNEGSLKTISFTLQKPGNNLVKKVKLVSNGNEMYELYGNYAKQDLSEKYNRFFEDFKVLTEKKPWDMSQSKTNKLADLIKDADLKKINEINHWWNALEFTKEDIPSLQNMLLKIYPDFDSSYYNTLNNKVFDKIELLDSNHTTVEYIKSNYSLIQPKNDYIKGYVISYLASIYTKESYSTLKECLTKYPFTLERVPYFAYSLYDSLSLVATLFPELMTLAGSEALWDQITNTSSNLLDSNLLAKSVIKEYGKYFIETANRELQKEKNEIEEYSYSYSSLIKLLGIIGSPEAIAILKKFEKFDAREIKLRTFVALLESNQAADTKTAFTLATTDEYRHDLYDELKRINKLKLFPANYLSQKNLGRSKVFRYATEDDDIPGLITDAGERTILYKGRQQRFYLYKVPYSVDDDTEYLGVAGPYNLNLKDLSSTHSATGMFWVKEFDAKKIDAFFKEYLASLEDVVENE